MGTWGNGLFEDDLALDIKGEFDRAVADGAAELAGHDPERQAVLDALEAALTAS